MNNSTKKINRQDLIESLDRLVERANQYLQSWLLKNHFHQVCNQAILLFFVLPLVFLFLQLVRIVTGFSGLSFLQSLGFWQYLGLSLLVPILFVVFKVIWFYLNHKINRRTALSLFDEKLGLKDRLATADEFLVEQDSVKQDTSNKMESIFKQAAIDDAQAFVKPALSAQLDPIKAYKWQGNLLHYLSVPVTLILILLALWMNHWQSTAWSNAETPAFTEVEVEKISVAENKKTPETTKPVQLAQLDKPLPEDVKPLQTKTDKAELDQLLADKKDSSGKSQAGRQADAKSSSNSSNSSGTPSDQSSSANKKNKQKQQTEQKPKKQSQQQQAERNPKQNESQKASSTSGAAQSKSSSRSQSELPTENREDKADPNEEDEGENEEVEDEDEQQKSSSANKPNFRLKKPPANRQMSMPGGTLDLKLRRKASRGGKSGLKKSRGVASMILGIPVPDRIKGIPNNGRTKMVQEKATPKQEDATLSEAEVRAARDNSFGHLQHPELSPWMQDLIKNYFLTIRQQSTETEEGQL